MKKLFLPIYRLLKISPILLKYRNDTHLHPIFRSYISWMPLCIFSEPLVWLKMLFLSSFRFENEKQKPHSFYVPYLSSTAYPFREHDKYSKFLEENVETITQEFMKVFELEVGTPSQALVQQGKWNTFPLMRAASLFSKNIEKCPKTWSIVQQCPLLNDVRGGVYFSIIYPGTRISPHCGPSNLKLRYHLTLLEAKDAWIRSGNEWRTWKRGECMILDDSFEHEVKHQGKEIRVVLIVDCWNPDLSEDEKHILKLIHTAFR